MKSGAGSATHAGKEKSAPSLPKRRQKGAHQKRCGTPARKKLDGLPTFRETRELRGTFARWRGRAQLQKIDSQGSAAVTRTVPIPPPDEVKVFPAYTLAEAARYVGVSETTLRTWFRGQPARSTKKGAFRKNEVKPMLPTDAGPREPLSFLDLIIAHILFSLRKSYKFPMRRVAKAKEYLASLGGNLAFMAHRDFFHDHSDLYMGMDETLLTLTQQGQMADKTILQSGLHQIIYGADGYADEFFPKIGDVEQREFAVNPNINYGRISIVRLGIKADVVAARYNAGEKMVEIAEDYGATPEEIIEAIRWNDRLAA